MKTRIIYLTFFLLMVPRISCQDRMTEPLKYSISIDKQVYYQYEPIIVESSVLNTGVNTYEVSRPLAIAMVVVKYRLLDAENQDVYITVTGSGGPAWKFPVYTLKSKQSITHSSQLFFAIPYEIKLEPGTYTLSSDYYPFPDADAFVSSNEIRIEIKKLTPELEKAYTELAHKILYMPNSESKIDELQKFITSNIDNFLAIPAQLALAAEYDKHNEYFKCNRISQKLKQKNIGDCEMIWLMHRELSNLKKMEKYGEALELLESDLFFKSVQLERSKVNLRKKLEQKELKE